MYPSIVRTEFDYSITLIHLIINKVTEKFGKIRLTKADINVYVYFEIRLMAGCSI